MKTKCSLCFEESPDEQWEIDSNFDLICPACSGIIPVHSTLTGRKKSDPVIQQVKKVEGYSKSVIGTPMHGDLIEFRGEACEVSIQGYQGAYRYVGGVYTNCAMSDHGFVKYNDIDYRVKWTNRARILKRKHPELFPKEKW